MSILHDVPFDDYVKIDAINWSKLKHMDESPLSYRHHATAPDRDTPSRLLGRLAHSLTLEPGASDDVVVWEGGDRRGKAWQAFAAANEGRTIVKPGEIDSAREMAAAVRGHPLVAPYLPGAQFEVTTTWTDHATGLKCKARQDWMRTDTLIDMKTTTTINSLRFTSQAEKLGYFGQLAHYRAGLVACGHPVARVLIVAVESKAPYDVGVFEVSEMSLGSASVEVADMLARLSACLKADTWPGRYETEQPLIRPDWALGGDLTFTPDED